MTKGEKKEERPRVEEKYKALVETAADAIFTLDLLGRFTFANPAAERVSGYSEEEILGKHFRVLLPAKYIPGCLNVFQKALRGQLTPPIEIEMITKQGERVPLEVLGRPIKRGRRVVEIVGITRDITERKRAEEALRESEARYRRFVELSPDTIAVHSEGKIAFINSAGARLLGAANPEQLIGKPIMDFLHPDYRDTVKGRIGSMYEGGKAASLIEEKFVRLDGTVIDVEVVAIPFTYQGKPAVQAIARDITERKRADEAVRESEERLSAFMDSAPDAFALFDSELNLVEMNKAASDMLPAGIKKEDVIGKNILDIALGLKETGRYDRYLRVIKTGEPLFIEDVVPVSEFVGDRHLAVKVFKVGDGLGMITTDITERKQAEEALQESKELFEKTFISQRDAIFLLDAKSPPTIMDCNPRAIEVFGYTREEMLGRTTAFLHFDETTLKEFQEQLYPAIEERGFLHLHEFKMRRKDGKVFPSEHSVVPLEDEQGKRIGWVSVVRDITERKQAEEAYRAVVDHSLQGLVIVQDFRFVFANQAFAEISGYTIEELLSLSPEEVRSVVHPEDQALVWGRFRDRLEEKPVPPRYEYRGIRKNGTVGWLEMFATPIEYRGRPAVQAAIVDITERKQMEEALRDHTEQLETLRQVGLELSAQLNLDALLGSIVSRAVELLKGSAGGLYLYRPKRDVLEWAVSIGSNMAPIGSVLRRGEGLSGKVWETGEPLIVDDYQHWEGQAAIYEDYPFTAVVGVPVRWGEEFLGVLNILADAPRTFSPADAELLSLLATEAAIAIENARLYQAEQSKSGQLAKVLEVGDDLKLDLELDRLLEKIAQAIRESLGFNMVAVNVISEDGKAMVTRTVAGLPDEGKEKLLGAIIPMTELKPLLQDRFKISRSYFISHEAQAWDERTEIFTYIPDSKEWRESRWHPEDGLLVPLETREERLVGLLSVDDPIDGTIPSLETIHSLEIFANQAAIAIENARLYENLKSRLDQLSGLHDISQAFSAMTDVRETFGELTKRIAQLIGCPMCFIATYDQRAREMHAEPPGYGISDELVRSLQYKVDGPARESWNFRLQGPLLANDRTQIPSFFSWWTQYHGIFNLLVVPLSIEGRITGLAYAANKPGGFTQGDARLLTMFANHAAIAIQNARLYEQEQERRQEAETLRQAAQALSATLDLQEVFESILSELQRMVPYDSASVQLLKGDRLEIIGGHGFPNLDELLGISFPVEGDNPNRQVVATRAPFIVEDAPAVYSTFREEPHAQAGIRAWLGVPLLFGDRLIGMIALDKRVPGYYTEEHARLALAFAAQAAIAIENAHLYQEAQKRLAETTVLHRVAEVINSTLELKEVFQRVVEELSETFGYRLVDIYLLEESGLRLQANFGYDEKTTIELIPLERGVIGRVARTGQPAFIRDVSQDPDYIGSYPDITGEICVPVKSGETLLGTLNVECDGKKPLTDDDLKLLSTLSSHIGVAIENALLYEEEQRLSTQRKTIAEVGRTAAAILDMDTLISRVVHLIAQGFRYYRVHIFQVDQGSGYAVYRAGTGEAALTIAEEGLRLKIGEEGLVGWVALHGQPLLVNDVSKDPRYYSHPELPDTRSELDVPIRIGEEIIGVLNVQSTELNAFDESDLATLQTLANQLAVAMENARLYQETRRLAITDSLTGLYNLRYFYEALEREIQRSERYHRSVSLIILDIDDFKAYNDRYGHLAGDHLLIELAHLMSEVTRRTDTVARYGGEEFAIILPETETEGARVLAERLLEKVREHRFSTEDGQTIGRITISLGAATYPHHADSAKALVGAADKALLRAKRAGKNRLFALGEELIELKPR